MNRMEIAVGSLTGKDAEKAFQDMSMACNTYGLDIKGFLELVRQDPQSVKVWTGICWYWVSSLSRRYGIKGFDQRNEQSCYTGYLLQQTVDEKYEPLTELARDDFITVFISHMAYDHRTIQQSFSSLVFAWLDFLTREKGERKAKHAVARMKTERGERWYNMPMI